MDSLDFKIAVGILEEIRQTLKLAQCDVLHLHHAEVYVSPYNSNGEVYLVRMEADRGKSISGPTKLISAHLQVGYDDDRASVAGLVLHLFREDECHRMATVENVFDAIHGKGSINGDVINERTWKAAICHFLRAAIQELRSRPEDARAEEVASILSKFL